MAAGRASLHLRTQYTAFILSQGKRGKIFYVALHYPKALALELDPVELAGYMVCSRDVLVEVVEHLRIWRSLEDELSGASRSIHLSWQ